MEPKTVLSCVVMLVAGTATTMLTKLSNEQKSEGRDGEEREFKHPVLQCWGLSVGEAGCILLFLAVNLCKEQRQRGKETEVKEKTPFNIFLFVPPAVLHLTSRIFTFIALTLTTASSFEMLTGTNLIFVSILSRIFLKKSLAWYKWFAILVISVGVVVVGISDMKSEDEVSEEESRSNPVLGDIFVVIAMAFYACQLTYEEKFVKKYNIKPMNAIGLEGSFAVAILSVMLVVLYFIPVKFDMEQPGGQLDDALDGFVQLGNNPILLISFLLTTVALCFTLVAGINVTRKLSAVHRLVINSGRSVIVWAISLAVGWQTFQPLQIVGFLIMSLGVLIFNDILLGPAFRAVLRQCGCLKEEAEDAEVGSTNTDISGKDNPVVTISITTIDDNML